jgi:DNA-binding response OmpR family regulator
MKNSIDILKNKNVILIEDDVNLQDSMKKFLDVFFDIVYISSDGIEAISLIENNRIDVIITDYVLPSKSGANIAEYVRQKDENIPIILISNYTDKDKLLKIIPLNITEYLVKPIEYDDIIKVFEKISIKFLQSNVQDDFYQISSDIFYDMKNKIIVNNQKEYKLTKSEFVLFELLYENKNNNTTIENLEFTLSPSEHMRTKSIQNIIYRLRKKLGENLIQTIPQIGYKMSIDF